MGGKIQQTIPTRTGILEGSARGRHPGVTAGYCALEGREGDRNVTRFISGPFSTLMACGSGAEVSRIDETRPRRPTMDRARSSGKGRRIRGSARKTVESRPRLISSAAAARNPSRLNMRHAGRHRDLPGDAASVRRFGREQTGRGPAGTRAGSASITSQPAGQLRRIVHCAWTATDPLERTPPQLRAYDLMIQGGPRVCMKHHRGGAGQPPSKAAPRLGRRAHGARFAVSGNFFAGMLEQRSSGQGAIRRRLRWAVLPARGWWRKSRWNC